ncbi:hypothetical protein QIG23_28090, partial [Klebsiella pneumoniae]|nr:hypothetical protein [Klebsiella pneumoniae]
AVSGTPVKNVTTMDKASNLISTISASCAKPVSRMEITSDRPSANYPNRQGNEIPSAPPPAGAGNRKDSPIGK